MKGKGNYVASYGSVHSCFPCVCKTILLLFSVGKQLRHALSLVNPLVLVLVSLDYFKRSHK